MLTEKFKKQFTWLGENNEKYIAFTIHIENEATIADKNGKEVTKDISCILQFIDTTRFMASSLLNLDNNFIEGTHKIKCKYRHDDKKCETCRIKYKYCESFLEYINFKDDLMERKCLLCQVKFDEKLKERFFSILVF